MKDWLFKCKCTNTFKYKSLFRYYSFHLDLNVFGEHQELFFSVSSLCVSVTRRLRRKSHVQLFKQICVSFWGSQESFIARRSGDLMKVSVLPRMFPLKYTRSNKDRLKSTFDLDWISLRSRRISWDLICDVLFLLVMMCCCWNTETGPSASHRNQTTQQNLKWTNSSITKPDGYEGESIENMSVILLHKQTK